MSRIVASITLCATRYSFSLSSIVLWCTSSSRLRLCFFFFDCPPDAQGVTETEQIQYRARCTIEQLSTKTCMYIHMYSSCQHPINYFSRLPITLYFLPCAFGSSGGNPASSPDPFPMSGGADFLANTRLMFPCPVFSFVWEMTSRSRLTETEQIQYRARCTIEQLSTKTCMYIHMYSSCQHPINYFSRLPITLYFLPCAFGSSGGNPASSPDPFPTSLGTMFFLQVLIFTLFKEGPCRLSKFLEMECS